MVASVVDFYSNDPSSNPAEATVFAVKFVFEKNEKKRPGLSTDDTQLKLFS